MTEFDTLTTVLADADVDTQARAIEAVGKIWSAPIGDLVTIADIRDAVAAYLQGDAEMLRIWYPTIPELSRGVRHPSGKRMPEHRMRDRAIILDRHLNE